MKSVLITGSSAGGIGAALCREFQEHGLLVFATARDVSRIDVGLKDLPNVILVTLDVTCASSVAAAVEVVKERAGGQLDYLVNNAGAQYVSPMLDANIEAAKAMYDVNVWGCVAMVQAFAPLIIPGKGTIVNIASISGYLNAPFMSLYNGSKAAIDMISETLRLELAPFDVKVITCVTGAIATELMSKSRKKELPGNSLYTPIANNIAARARGDDVKDASTAEDFAHGLVSDVLGGVSGHVYHGKLSTTTRILFPFLPAFIRERLLTSSTGLSELPSK